MKKKLTGPKSQSVKSAAVKSTAIKSAAIKSKVSVVKGGKAEQTPRMVAKGATKISRNRASKITTSKTAEAKISESKVVKVSSSSTTKVSIAERLSKSGLVKSAAVVKLKTQRAKLKLVGKQGAKVPVSKITRSEHSTSTSNVVVAKFGGEATPAANRPVLAVRQSIEKMIDDNQDGSSNPVMFKVGDKIVYPGHGVGEIEDIKTHVLEGEAHHIYNIKILDSGMKVMVPVSQASSVGLRRIIDKKAIDTVYGILRDRNFKIDTQTWNRRFREYSQKIKTGSVFEIAIVLRDLSVLSADKELSFGEKKMLDMAEALLVSEIAIAKARPHDKVAGELKSLFV